MRKTFALIASFFVSVMASFIGAFDATAAPASPRTAIVPAPISLTEEPGEFTLTQHTTIACPDSLREYAEYLRDIIDGSTGWRLNIVTPSAKAGITLGVNNKTGMAPEGYTLSVAPTNVQAVGADRGGLFYAIQTLLQLFPEQIYAKSPQRDVEWTAPCVTVADAPERPWRGMMLDVARYFHDVDYVKHFIDMMAMYKLNKLQFHLIDDSGWRLESKKYPRLTEVGAYSGPEYNKLGGYYTQDDIRDLIEYGRLRNVEIIPEIEFPAHILSAIVAYPWLSCTGLQHELPRQHFISRDLLCVGKDSSIKFITDILDETIELFPSKYINIGGDEAVYTRWEECEDCQALMRREGLSKASELQGWLTDSVARMMGRRDRTVIGWEEIITRGDVSTPVVALVWHDVNDTTLVKPGGHQAILTPATHMYIDFPESSTPGEIKAATWMPPISLERAYSMPVNDYSDNSSVIGVMGSLWSDQFIHGTVLQELPQLNENRSEKYMDYLAFPRMLAISEVAWGKESKRDFPEFRRRVGEHYARIARQGATYRVPEPLVTSIDSLADGRLSFTLAPSVPGSQIRYTTDGTYPTIHSPLYDGKTPVIADSRADFHAITVVNPKMVSLPVYYAPDYSAYAPYGTFTYEWGPLQVQPIEAPWIIDATGKISGNGTYEIAFIPTKGSDPLHLGNLRLMKRNEQLDEAIADNTITASGEATPAVYTVKLDSFEAGTPFSVVVDQIGPKGNQSHGLVFIRKL